MRLLFSLLVAAAFSAPVATRAAERPAVADWSLRTADGGTVRFTEALSRGPVVVSFWALWCRPCLLELPHLDVLARAAGDSLTVLAVNIDSPKSVAKVRPYLKSKGYALTVPLDTAGEVSRLMQVGSAVPFLVLYDTNGREAYRHIGYKEGDERELRDAVTRLLAEPADSTAVRETE